MSILLLYEFIVSKDFNSKIISIFLFTYFFIPFLNISTYRGSISFNTLTFYCCSNIFILLILYIFSHKNQKKISVTYINQNISLYMFAFIHILLSYILIGYIYYRYGNILVNQEIRFMISPTLGYLIKSTIYIPLIFSLIKRKKSIRYYFTFMVLPLFPAFLLGSRGTVIMIILGVLFIFILMQKEKKSFINKINIHYKEIKRRHLLFGLSISTVILYGIFYVRRIGSEVYVSSAELVKKYFDVAIPVFFIYMILPIYFNLRETVGITNTIIQDNLRNDGIIPMFFLEIFTILPGKQDSPGILLGELIGKVGDAGLTPGMIGGLYLDLGFWAVIFPCIFIFLISYFYQRSSNSDIFKLLYVLSLIQFFHIYHRGFLKLEYIMSFIIILIYLSLSGAFKLKNENSSHSLSIDT